MITLQKWKRNLYVCAFGAFSNSAAISQIAPILPLYIQHLGVHDTASIEMWSGLAFGCTNFIAAFFSPFWGTIADKYGRKLMMLRASFGMSIILTSIGFVSYVYQIVILRALMGSISGFNSGAITLVATQSPKERAGWALGTLSTGSIGGSLLGPLVGGYLAEIMGFRYVFISMGLFTAFAFILTLFFVREDFTPPTEKLPSSLDVLRHFPEKSVLFTLFFSCFCITAALFSIEPIITIYIGMISKNTAHLAFISGLVFAASGFSSILAAPTLGRVSDRIGAHRIIFFAVIAAACLFIPQAFVQSPWQLLVLRLFIGVAFGAIFPAMNAILKHISPSSVAGRIFSYTQTGQFLGVSCGAITGGQIAALLGIRNLFFLTSALLFFNAIFIYKYIFTHKNFT